MRRKSLEHWSATVGGGLWIASVWLNVPNLHHGAWAYAILLLAAFILFPLAMDVIRTETIDTAPSGWVKTARILQLPAAVSLAWSCTRTPGVEAGLAAIPWFFVCTLTAFRGVSRIVLRGAHSTLDAFCVDVSMSFLGVGGLWVLADRTGFRPLDFPDAIVALTAVHFHFAGLLLPLIAGLTVRFLRVSKTARFAAAGVVIGIPAVAVGITTTQLGAPPWIEACAGGELAVSGLVIGLLQIRIAFISDTRLPVRALLGLAGLSLIFGMMLAGIYAFRSIALPLPWLDVPWMRALHGTANALGFGLCGMLGWRAMFDPQTCDAT